MDVDLTYIDQSVLHIVRKCSVQRYEILQVNATVERKQIKYFYTDDLQCNTSKISGNFLDLFS